MASFTHRCHYYLFFLVLVFASHCHETVSASRPLTSSTSTLVARLKLLNGDQTTTMTCWETLIQLHACTGEIILFFVNGETYIGKSCCLAIRTITHHCWPSMIDSLGFTTEEGDILDTYCTITTAPDSPLPTTPPPAVSVSLQV